MTVNKLIAITGPAAVGKSTVARELQSELIRSGELWLVIELDTFARGLSRDWISFGKHQGRYAERGFVYARGQDGGIELRVGPDGRSVLAAFHRSVAAIARSGVGVICETIVYDDDDTLWDKMGKVARTIYGASDAISVVIRQSLIQLRTPYDMLGRVMAVNALCTGSSGTLGEFRAGVVAAAPSCEEVSDFGK
jgi:hypothetical protein